MGTQLETDRAMTKTPLQTGVLALALAAWLGGPALAQETTGWSVLQETDPVECYAVSTPISQENREDGQPVEMARSNTFLFVLFRPSEGLSGQVIFSGGYAFRPGSPVILDVEGTQFTLFTEDEWAWPETPEEDAGIVEAFRKSSEAVLIGRSERGTVIYDTFSLMGFTSSMEEAQRLCAS